MDNRPVFFIDSGIGGLPYYMDFIKKNPKEAVFYLADRENFPYGPRGKEELKSILISLTEKIIKRIDPKIIVLACNTATISALSSLRQNFPQIPFVGTVPAIKPAANACNNGKVGVLGTAQTIKEVNSLGLADNTCKIFGIAAPELVDFIEMEFDNSDEDKKIKTAKKYIDLFRAEKVDTLVLGCTHFLFLLDEFRSTAKPYFEVFESIEGITKRIEFLLDENDSVLRADDGTDEKTRRLLLTGSEPANSLWQTRAQKYGFNLSLFNDI